LARPVITQAMRRKAQQQRAAVIRLEKQALRFASRGIAPSLGIKGLLKVQPVLRDCMVASYLVGLEDVLKQRPVVAGSNPFINMVKSLASRIGLRIGDVRDAFDDKARDAISDMSRKAEEQLAEELEELAEEGALRSTGQQALANTFDKLGISPTNSYQLENVFRTHTLMGYGAGRWQAMQDPVVQEILEAFRYVTVGDDRVREEHAALEGMTAAADHEVWRIAWPPNGYSCRCQVLMVFDWDGEEWVPSDDVIQDAITPGFGYNPGELFTTA
jgi:SPP1 gp7 family putative phage head morphogenesis protein